MSAEWGLYMKQHSSAYKWTVLAILMVGTAILYYSNMIFAVRAPDTMAKFAINEGQLAAISTIGCLPGAFLSVVVGRVLDRKGVKLFTAAGLILTVACMVWRIFAHTYIELMLATVLIGAFLLPIVSGGSNILAMWVGQKLNNTVATNEKGEQDKDAAKMAQSMNTMLFVMPLISVWIGFTMPAAVTVYWIAQSIFGLVFDSLLTVHCRKAYAAEDEIRREKARIKAAEEAEKERIRAERRAANPDGITENTSKKKQERKEREEREAAQREFAAKKAGIDLEAEKAAQSEKCPSGIPERPYCRGRAYKPDRYRKGGAQAEDAAE